MIRPGDIRIINELMDQYADFIDPAGLEFGRRVFADGIEKYQNRLAQYGFAGIGRVLDAGCGLGQWTLALAGMSQVVHAVDVAFARAVFVNSLLDLSKVGNAAVTCASLTDLPFQDRTFDAVFCYGVLFTTPWRESLSEMSRIVRPGGRIYLSANGPGWFRHLERNEPHKSRHYDPRSIARAAFLNTKRYDSKLSAVRFGPLIIDPDELRAALRQHGFSEVRHAAEGMLVEAEYRGPTTPPFFMGEYEGELGVYEVIAIKG